MDGFAYKIISSPEVYFHFFKGTVYYNQIVRIEREQSQINFTCKLFPIPPIQKSQCNTYFSVALDEGC